MCPALTSALIHFSPIYPPISTLFHHKQFQNGMCHGDSVWERHTTGEIYAGEWTKDKWNGNNNTVQYTQTHSLSRYSPTIHLHQSHNLPSRYSLTTYLYHI